MRQLISLVVAGFAIVNGFRVIFADDCSTVSFDAVGGRYASAIQCYADNSGAVPAWVAGGGVILFGLIVLLIGFAGR